MSRLRNLRATILLLLLCFFCREVNLAPLRLTNVFIYGVSGSKYEPLEALYECVKEHTPIECYGIEANLVRSVLGNGALIIAIASSGETGVASKYIDRTCDISFNVTALVSMSNNESAASAEVWVLKQRLSNREIEELSSGGCNTTSVVLQLSPTSDGVATPSHSRVTLERDDLKKDTWIRFGNLTDLYTKWIGDQTGGIQRLTISAPEGCSSARLGFVASASDTSEREPILVVFINDYHPAADFDGRIVPDGNFGLQKNSTAPNSLVKRYQPTQPEAGQLSACHLVPSQIDLTDLGFNADSFLEDPKIEFNLCVGTCPNPASNSPLYAMAADHTSFLYYLRTRDAARTYPAPCCAPSSYGAATLRKYTNSVFSIWTIRTATAKSCSCVG
ncbi:hypothetical protein EMCRGX_G014596 [Ephydatia muelleri]